MIQGDTIQLRVNFKSFKGNLIDPDNVKLTIYKSDKTQIEQIAITDSDKESVGVYFYDYTPASELNEFIFEFAGSYNSKPILARGKVELKFI
ncbi:hypothetical protein JGK52_03885 [Cytobacillus oceanisediminis]|uniref:hypothetical protein n=1 Tax=Cytobacillus oceanisediminis TaxID=665099 RepID=UPI001D136BA8|nr:hypothetical protein [Cytobacillus oceanisediminis]MCC3645825.1 hypothetical protein [Cytobacillus oceanisediminis]